MVLYFQRVAQWHLPASITWISLPLAAGHLAILISHRLSTVRMANRIYVLEGGQIVESGTHEELVRCGGRYAQLFSLQAQAYR
jgi:ATP-binding cassette, subfamily B, bacterial